MKNILFASLSLLALLVVGACNKSTQLGSNLFENLDLTFTDTTTVVAQTENPDSILAVSVASASVIVSQTKMPLGKMLDPIFGTTEARIYANLGYPSGAPPAFDLGTSYVFDSVKFVLAYNAPDVYGDTTEIQNISLYRLDASESLSGENFTYYTNKKFKTAATRLGGTNDFLPFPNSKVVLKKSDTILAELRPHINFRLSDDFGKALLDTNVYSTTNAFAGSIAKYFRGFELRAEKTTNAMLSFNMADDSSGIYIHYRKVGDTTKYTYRFAFLSTTFPSYTHNIAQGSINNYYNGKKTISGDSLMFLQGMAGPSVKIEFPNFRKQVGTAAINRAELEFTIKEDATSEKYPPIERFILTTASGVPVADLRRNSSTAALEYGGTIVTEAGNLRRYKCNISQHVGEMLNGTTGTILYLKADNTRGSYPNKQETTRRVVIYGTKHPKYRTKLNLYYTKP